MSVNVNQYEKWSDIYLLIKNWGDYIAELSKNKISRLIFLKDAFIHFFISQHDYMKEEEGFPEPWSFLTVNLGVTCPENCAFVDINNNGEEILDFIINNNIGKPTGRCKTS